MRPRIRAALGAAAAVVAVAAPTTASAPTRSPDRSWYLTALRVSNGDTRYAGDGPLLTTISPNGDGFRDEARISFRLLASARVRVDVVRTRPGRRVVWSRGGHLTPGVHAFRWRPPAEIEPRTYLVRLTTIRASSAHRLGAIRASDAKTTPVVRVQGIDAAAARASYRPGEAAALTVAADAPSLSLRVFRSDELTGAPVSDAVTLAGRFRRAPGHVRVHVGAEWPSGMYFARLDAPDGRVGFAPFVVRPRRLGEHRVAIVMPTHTWQAYNFYDRDGNGFGDTWYAGWAVRKVYLRRPYLQRGAPPFFRHYDLPFLRWLAAHRKEVDVLAQEDLERAPSGSVLAQRYDLIVFPGHHEYVTAREYDVVEDFRDLGGNLAFLSANNFYWRVVRRGSTLTRARTWRSLGRPEASLIGVQYRANDRGARRGRFVVRAAGDAPWLFDSTGLVDGYTFGRYGIEIDTRAARSPRETQVLAELRGLFRGVVGEMTYYETPRGAKVFAAGAFTLAGRAFAHPDGQLLANLWRRLTAP